MHWRFLCAFINALSTYHHRQELTAVLLNNHASEHEISTGSSWTASYWGFVPNKSHNTCLYLALPAFLRRNYRFQRKLHVRHPFDESHFEFLVSSACELMLKMQFDLAREKTWEWAVEFRWQLFSLTKVIYALPVFQLQFLLFEPLSASRRIVNRMRQCLESALFVLWNDIVRLTEMLI